MIGIIEFYDDQKGFGFVRFRENRYFFHIKQFEENYTPSKFDLISFTISKGRDNSDCAISMVSTIPNYFS